MSRTKQALSIALLAVILSAVLVLSFLPQANIIAQEDSQNPAQEASKARIGAFGSVQTDLVKQVDFLSMVENKSIEQNQPDKPAYEAADIHLPYFNLEGAAAEEANAEIMELATKIAATFDSPEDFKLDTRFDDVNFTVYENGEILSVHLYYTEISAAYFDHNLTFNFDLTTGERLSREQLAERFGIHDNLLAVLEKNLKRLNDNFYAAKEEGKTPWHAASYLAESLELLWYEFSGESTENHVKLFVDPAGRLAWTYQQATPAGTGWKLQFAPLDCYILPADPALNPDYLKFRQYLTSDDEASLYFADLGTILTAETKPQDLCQRLLDIGLEELSIVKPSLGVAKAEPDAYRAFLFLTREAMGRVEVTNLGAWTGASVGSTLYLIPVKDSEDPESLRVEDLEVHYGFRQPPELIDLTDKSQAIDIHDWLELLALNIED